MPESIQAGVKYNGFQSLSKMSFGSGFFEGKNGGEGYIGLLGDRVIKTHTKGSERNIFTKDGTGVKKDDDKELFNDILESCNNLRTKIQAELEKIGISTKEDLIDKLNLDRKDAEQIFADKSLLSRKVVAHMLNKFDEKKMDNRTLIGKAFYSLKYYEKTPFSRIWKNDDGKANLTKDEIKSADDMSFNTVRSVINNAIEDTTNALNTKIIFNSIQEQLEGKTIECPNGNEYVEWNKLEFKDENVGTKSLDKKLLTKISDFTEKLQSEGLIKKSDTLSKTFENLFRSYTFIKSFVQSCESYNRFVTNYNETLNKKIEEYSKNKIEESPIDKMNKSLKNKIENGFDVDILNNVLSTSFATLEVKNVIEEIKEEINAETNKKIDENITVENKTVENKTVENKTVENKTDDKKTYKEKIAELDARIAKLMKEIE